MAAFIQKFFKGRQAAKPTSTSAKPAVAKAPEEQPVRDVLAEQQAQLAASPTTQQLETLALEGKTAELRLQAAAALSDRDALQRLNKAAKGRDKGVYQVVRQKLQQIRDQEAEQARRAEQVEELVRQAREQAVTENTQLYQAKLDNLLKHWREVEDHASSAQTTDFLNAVRQCRERVHAMEFEAQQHRLHASKADERSQTLRLLEDTLQQLKAQPEEHLASLASLDALQKTQENRWLEATRNTEVEKSEQRSYETLMQGLRAYIVAVQRFSHHLGQLETLLGAADSDTPPDNWHSQASALVEVLDWPDGFSQPAALARLRKAVGERTTAPAANVSTEQQRAHAQSLEDTLARLEAALEARQLKESRQLFKQAQQQLRALDSRHSRPFQARFQLLNAQLRELQDWQGFATQPKQVELCERMEYLAEQPMDPEVKAEKIKELQHEWRELGGSSDRDLWQRFKQASDRAYEPCKAYFSAKSGLKQANLDKREAICEELAHFVANTDWSSVDWKAVEHIHRVARDEWKAAWPVDFRDNRPLQKRFDELLKQVEAPLNAEREKNEAAKQAIVERAQALVDHEPLSEAMNQAKDLQNQWKAIGVTRHRQDRKLWQAFRAACDQIFGRRDEARQAQQEQAREADQKLEVLLARTAAAAEAAPTERLAETLTRDLGDLRAARSEPLSPAMAERLGSEIGRLSRLQEKLTLRQKSQSWQERIDRRLQGQEVHEECPPSWRALAQGHAHTDARDLVIRAEILTTLPSPEPDQARRMEIQVQRLAEGMSGSGDTGNQSEQMEALVATWCLAVPAEQLTEDLADRLKAAVQAATA
ncbi:MAG: DUF349 domain-containing protein [Marinobacter sp.]|uniref:DUF349 domain-containing protein n=1 Tax=Marinobacter sp. TaxID=50741 RepID=UPI00299E80E2|nr:DUF349 domain-containing protein [Marinobacter sp.]MDX1634849.1 DUF349 domain-containing protein [Marinobacter sp.]